MIDVEDPFLVQIMAPNRCNRDKFGEPFDGRMRLFFALELRHAIGNRLVDITTYGHISKRVVAHGVTNTGTGNELGNNDRPEKRSGPWSVRHCMKTNASTAAMANVSAVCVATDAIMRRRNHFT